MNTPLLISVLTNILLYVIIAALVYKMGTQDPPNAEPLPQEEERVYRIFCIMIAVFWPLTLVYMYFDERVF